MGKIWKSLLRIDSSINRNNSLIENTTSITQKTSITQLTPECFAMKHSPKKPTKQISRHKSEILIGHGEGTEREGKQGKVRVRVWTNAMIDSKYLGVSYGMFMRHNG